MLDVLNDNYLFGHNFKNKSWDNWKTFLKSLFNISLTKTEAETFRQFTHRIRPSTHTTEAWLVVGRRGGKSLIAALAAVFLACFRDYSKYLSVGERGTVMVIAADRKQARVVMRYVVGFLESVPMLENLIERKVQDAVDLKNRVTIEVHTCSFRSTRGYSIVAAICDEIAFWRSEESANPDTEVLNAIRPGMGTITGSVLLCISSPYARRGELWNAYHRFYGKENDSVLVWQADTRSMNPDFSQRVIQQALERDESSARAEYLAEFRTDIESFVIREAVEAVVFPNRYELPPIGNIHYAAFTDPSGGSQDSFTLAIAHREKEKVILDCIREVKPPFSPEAVVKDFSSLLKRYRVHTVRGDRYAGEWPREQFRKNGINYRTADKPKSDIYRDFLPLINSARVELLDDQRLITQLVNLERRTGRGGKDSIDHGPGGHDDVVNAVGGAIVMASQISKFDPTWGRNRHEHQTRVPEVFRTAVVGSVKIHEHGAVLLPDK